MLDCAYTMCQEKKEEEDSPAMTIASVLENETQKLLWDFEIQTDPLISARQPDLPNCGLYCPGRLQSKI